MLVIGDAGAGGEEGVPGSRSSRTRPRGLASSGKSRSTAGMTQRLLRYSIVSHESALSPHSAPASRWNPGLYFRQFSKHLRQSSPQSLTRVLGAQEIR